MSGFLQNQLRELSLGNDVVETGAEPLLDCLIAETDEELLAQIFRAWNNKGITETEIYSIARIMRDRMVRVNSAHETFVDIVGTGGSKVKTFNVSTAAAFVVAGQGVAVAKHGNKAATSNSGSADVLSELGINHAVDAKTAERCLNEVGICFMFAPNFHRLSPTLGKVRRSLGFPTIFNCVGPLCNPASALHQLIGVWDRELVPKMANALARLGTKKSWIVHGTDGLDEISLSGRTLVAEVDGETVRQFTISPVDFGVRPESIDSLKVDTPHESAQVVRRIFNCEARDGAMLNLVTVNASAALCLSDSAISFEEAMSLARNSISEGHAQEKLEALVNATNK